MNPEIRRNILGEFTLLKLVILPIVTAVIFLLLYLIKDEREQFLLDILHWSKILIYGIFIVLGNWSASDSVIQEINDKTWLTQKMSSLSPWQMTVGKLIGSTSYAWYGSLFAIISYIVVANMLPNSIENIKFLVVILLIGVMSHAFSLTSSMIAISQNKDNQQLESAIHAVYGIILAGILINYGSSIHSENETLKWMGVKLKYSDFTIFGAAFFCTWTVISFYRTMRTEFNYTNGSVGWITFVATVMAFFSGIISQFDSFNFIELFLVCLFISLGVGVVINYLTLFNEPKQNLVAYIKRSGGKLKLLKINNQLPIWLLTLIISIGLTIFTVIFYLTTNQSFFETIVSYWFPINLILFLLRDVCIILMFNINDRIKRPNMVALLYLLVVYFLIPSLLSLTKFKMGNVMSTSYFLPIFVPDIQNLFFVKIKPEFLKILSNFSIGTLPILLQCSFAYIYLKKQIRKL